MFRQDDRGVSPVIGAVLMLAVVVIVGAAVGVFVFGLAGQQNDPSPNIFRVTSSLDGVGAGGDPVIRISEKGGDTVTISENTIDVVIAVEGATCNAQTRLFDPTTSTIGPDDFEGDDILVAGGLGGVFGTGSDSKWQSGDDIEIRISDSKCSLVDGDTVTYKIVHKPSATIIAEKELIAES